MAIEFSGVRTDKTLQLPLGYLRLVAAVTG
jgi:hypothetical protein